MMIYYIINRYQLKLINFLSKTNGHVACNDLQTKQGHQQPIIRPSDNLLASLWESKVEQLMS